MTLGFSVDALLPLARGGGALRMGLQRLDETEWLQPDPDLALRAQAFETFPDGIQTLPESAGPGAELAAMLGLSGDLADCARVHWEDMCLLTRRDGEPFHRLAGTAVAFPSDWRPADKIGLPLTAVHEPIHGYARQLSAGVDHFMDRLEPGALFGRSNWFVTPTPDLRWIAAEPPEIAFGHVTARNAGEALFVRCERQTLRRLPVTGAIVFTIGIYRAPLADLSAANRARIAAALGGLEGGEAGRRGAEHYAPALVEWVAAHDANGLPTGPD